MQRGRFSDFGGLLTSERVERRLAAVLAADVAGYSRLMGIDEEGTLARLKAFRKSLVDPTIAAHRGRIVKTAGDGMLVEFSSAVDAVRSAVEVQRGMAEQNATAPQDQMIQFRIGIHVGDIIIDENDIFGDGVNIAARVENECEPGGVCVSGNAFEQIRGKTNFTFNDLGERALRNIERLVRLYAVRGATSVATTITTAISTMPRDTKNPLPLPDKPSIAVLPFQNMSGDPDQEYFADGIVEDIITALSRFKSLFVIARNSSFTYKGNAVDIKQVGRELGVRYVLEGSVRKAGSRVRITGQLIEAATGAHLWADKFDGELVDVFDLQDRVTSSVVGAIGPKIEQIEIERVLRKPTSDLVAYGYYLRGTACWYRWTRAGNEEALQMFSRALELDPNYVAAIAAASTCYGQRVMQQWVVDPEKETADALRLAKRGLEVGRDDAWVLSTAAIIIMFTGDIETAVELSDRAIQINPNLDRGWSHSGWIRVFSGHPELAIEHSLRALQLNPLGSYRLLTLTPVALSYFLMDRNEEALIWAERALADNPSQLPTMRFVAAIKAINGRLEEAKQIVKDILKINPEDRFSKIALVRYIRRPDYRQKLVDALRLAGLPE
jgi:TolB-like protein/class 3 adenylate cyclase/tetratricopeptide (TPR) repeat protein